MHVKNGSKDLKRYPQISRRVRDTLTRWRCPQVGQLTGQDVDTTLQQAVGLAETVDYCR